MYFETGQGSALSSAAHHGADQVTIEARCYGLARRYKPFLVNTVVGFIGPEYLEDGPQITRAALEDHFMGKLLGLPMGCDACFTYHARMSQDELESLKVLLGAAGCTYLMSLPVGDDIMLNYQSTSYHDIPTLRRLLGKRPTPEFDAWLDARGIWRGDDPGPKFGDVGGAAVARAHSRLPPTCPRSSGPVAPSTTRRRSTRRRDLARACRRRRGRSRSRRGHAQLERRVVERREVRFDASAAAAVDARPRTRSSSGVDTSRSSSSATSEPRRSRSDERLETPARSVAPGDDRRQDDAIDARSRSSWPYGRFST